MQEENIQSLELIFDPSLFIAPSHLLLDEIWSDSNISIGLTKRMKELIFEYVEARDLHREARDLHMLLNAWVSGDKYALPAPWNTFKKQKFKVKELPKEVEHFRDHM